MQELILYNTKYDDTTQSFLMVIKERKRFYELEIEYIGAEYNIDMLLLVLKIVPMHAYITIDERLALQRLTELSDAQIEDLRKYILYTLKRTNSYAPGVLPDAERNKIIDELVKIRRLYEPNYETLRNEKYFIGLTKFYPMEEVTFYIEYDRKRGHIEATGENYVIILVNLFPYFFRRPIDIQEFTALKAIKYFFQNRRDEIADLIHEPLLSKEKAMSELIKRYHEHALK